MTEIEIKQMLMEANIPVFKGHAPIGTRVPYMVYNVSFDRLSADNITYFKIPLYEVNLYETAPSIELRARIEQLLTDNELSFSSDESDEEEQGLFLTIYKFGGLSNGRE
jgi:hypothetical protein